MHCALYCGLCLIFENYSRDCSIPTFKFVLCSPFAAVEQSWGDISSFTVGGAPPTSTGPVMSSLHSQEIPSQQPPQQFQTEAETWGATETWDSPQNTGTGTENKVLESARLWTFSMVFFNRVGYIRIGTHDMYRLHTKGEVAKSLGNQA